MQAFAMRVEIMIQSRIVIDVVVEQNIQILSEYIDFANVFSEDKANKLIDFSSFYSFYMFSVNE